MIKVSVITPIFNREKWVKNLLDNLLAQTLPEIEFIIIDDGSTDNTFTLLKQKTQKDIRFHLIKNAENKGPYQARNLGLKQAKGEYIGFFDCDDKIPQDYFQSLYEQAASAQADIIYAMYNNEPHRIAKIQTEADKFKALKNGAIWDKLYKRTYLNAHKICFTEGLYTADNLFVLKTFLQTDKIILTPTPNYEYTVQEDSIGKDVSKKAKRKKDIIEVLKKALALKTEFHLSAEASEEYQKFLQRSLKDYPNDKHFQTQFYKILGLKKEPQKEPTMKLALLKLMRLTHLLNKKKYNDKRYVELVNASPLFDTKWYLANNPDVKSRKMSAAKHYVKYGWKEGRNPSPKFDGNQYLADYPDVMANTMCPLVHYLICGSKEGRCYNSVTGEMTCPNVDELGLLGKLRYALEYPLHLQEECDRLKNEIRMLKQS